ncbi:hypothetical protein ACEI36_19985 [Pseudomonas kielensis]|uniref:hypothetical protein n=1 Tax=Pseudomonas kielensis TaxID=2762577 RepID=UPI0038AC5B03
MGNINITAINSAGVWARIGDNSSTEIYSQTTEFGLNYHSSDEFRFTTTRWGDEPAQPTVTLKNTAPNGCYLYAVKQTHLFADTTLLKDAWAGRKETFQKGSDGYVVELDESMRRTGIFGTGVWLDSGESASFDFANTQFVMLFEE